MVKKPAALLNREIAEVLHDSRHLRAVSHSTVSKGRGAVDKLLQRFQALDAKRREASVELRAAGRESDQVYDAETRGRPDPVRKKTADKRWSRAVHAEQALTNKMRDLVLKIRAIDPKSVPWGWQNTR